MGVALGQNLGQIRPNVVKKVKKWLLLIAFKAKNSGLQTSEWKFKENIARNITFEGC